MQKKTIAMLLSLFLLLTLLGGCQKTDSGQTPDVTAPPADPVTLTVVGSWPDFRALDVTAKAFVAQYPNCTIVYEYLQDYNNTLEKRLSGEEPVDLFLSTNIQEGAAALPHALNLYGRDDLDLSETFDGLISNFMYRGQPGEEARLYALPLGSEMRGLYVNKTLLSSLGLEVPTNQATLLAACETLKQNGFIPFHGNPGSFSQLLLYPWIASLIANAEDSDAVYARVNTREPGFLDMFRAPLEFLYLLVEKGYYDYKTAQTESNLFLSAANEDYARDFLNIRLEGEQHVKADDIGQVAFMPSPMSLDDTIARVKEDYHSEIEYVFIPAPIGPEGGFAYLSPAHGIAVCKHSANVDWALKFLDFLFRPENNKAFAQAFHVIPNTKEAFSYIHTLFDVPDNRISHLGEVTFDYGFYETLVQPMVEISKGNNPKYMRDDGAGNLSLYPLEHYLDALEAAFQQL